MVSGVFVGRVPVTGGFRLGVWSGCLRAGSFPPYYTVVRLDRFIPVTSSARGRPKDRERTQSVQRTTHGGVRVLNSCPIFFGSGRSPLGHAFTVANELTTVFRGRVISQGHRGSIGTLHPIPPNENFVPLKIAVHIGIFFP
jgi:hypothetical protein